MTKCRPSFAPRSRRIRSAFDVLAALQLRERFPRHLALIGIQPSSLECGIELTPEIEATLTCWR